MMKKKKVIRPDVEIGKFIGTEREFGFVEVAGMEPDIFIPAARLNGALHSDPVSFEFLHISRLEVIRL